MRLRAQRRSHGLTQTRWAKASRILAGGKSHDGWQFHTPASSLRRAIHFRGAHCTALRAHCGCLANCFFIRLRLPPSRGKHSAAGCFPCCTTMGAATSAGRSKMVSCCSGVLVEDCNSYSCHQKNRAVALLTACAADQNSRPDAIHFGNRKRNDGTDGADRSYAPPTA